jgi:hypothetical protein
VVVVVVVVAVVAAATAERQISIPVQFWMSTSLDDTLLYLQHRMAAVLMGCGG